MTNRKLATDIINRLQKAGHQALLAGGCVRDMILNRAAKDYDVATSAHPDEVIGLFKRTIRIGAKFGVVVVLDHDQQVEVATFRTETGYSDRRHPDTVEFASAREDAARRDFTINGMFYDPVSRQLLDFVGGQKDLANGIIRTIGDPRQRFAEDYLRILRAVRFAAQLSFRIEDRTLAAMKELSPNITVISAERIAMELETAFASQGRAQAAAMLVETGLSDAIFPTLAGQDAAFGIAVLGAFAESVDLPLALAALFCAVETKAALDAAAVLKLSNVQKKHIKFLLENREVLLDPDISLAQLRLLAAEPFFWNLYELQHAILTARNIPTRPLGIIKSRLLKLKGKELAPKPLLDGHQLIALGVIPGQMVGLVARQMYIAQLAEQINTPADAEAFVKNRLKKHHSLNHDPLPE
jgi:tRNA nucleotidyltransferase/poly(A) polymerase